MPFTTIDFIVFFAIVFIGYYALPHRFRWMLLLAGSWVFYGWLSPYYLIFLAFATALTYFSAVGMARNYEIERAWLGANGKIVSRDEKKAYKATMEKHRWWMSFGAIAGLLSMLIVFKYLGFIFANVAWLGGVVGFNWSVPSVNLILPIGLSFYVFQSMAYVIDVQRGEVEAECNFFKHALFVSYFPQIMQGPIGNYGRLAHQFFEQHDFSYEQAVSGILRVTWGFFKKVMIANIIADRINGCWTSVADYPGLICWSAILFLYAIQLYADFSGYVDIACGCSEMLGIKLDENFNCPYFAKSVSEFWRRWHMSLSSWFKDYLFYPVLRSNWNTKVRKLFTNKYLASVVPTSLALAIVWAATGLWHGASWGYVAWGVYYGIFMILGIVMAPIYDWIHNKFPKFTNSKSYIGFQMARTFLIVLIGYAIFKPANLHATIDIFCSMKEAANLTGVVTLWHGLHRTFWPVVAGGALMFMVDIIHYSHSKGTIRIHLRRLPGLVRWTIYVSVLLGMIFFGLYGSGFDQFEYFKF